MISIKFKVKKFPTHTGSRRNLYRILPNKFSFLISNEGGGGKNDSRIQKSDDDFNSITIIFLLFILVIYCIYSIVSGVGLRCDEIILKNCELLPLELFCDFFKFLPEYKNKGQIIFKTMENCNTWYLRKNYIFSFIEKIYDSFSENLYQIYIIGKEPKVKNIKINFESEIICLVLKELNIKPGNFYNWNILKIKKSYERVNFCYIKSSIRTLISERGDIFLDIFSKFEVKNLLSIKPEILFEKNNFSGIISIEKKNIFNRLTNFNTILNRCCFQNTFFLVKFQNLKHLTTKILFFIKKKNQKYTKIVFKIVKLVGQYTENRTKIISSYSLKRIKNDIKSSVKLVGTSVSYLNNNNTIKLFFVSRFYFVADQLSIFLIKGNFGSRLNFIFRIRLNLDPILFPQTHFQYISKTSICFNKKKFSLKQFFVTFSFQNLFFSNTFKLNFDTFFNKNARFFIFVDVFRSTMQKKNSEKSINFGIKFNRLFVIFYKIASNGQIKLSIDTL